MANITVTPSDIQAKVKTAKPGDVLLAVPSPTAYPGIVMSGINGEVDAPITLKAEVTGTVLFSGPVTNSRGCISFQGMRHWILSGLGVTTGRAGIYIGNCSDILIDECEVYKATVQGIQTGSSKRILIQKTRIYHILGEIAQHGIYFAGGESAEGCAVLDCAISDVARAAIQGNAQGEKTPIKGLRIERNSIWRTGLNNQAGAINLIGVQDSKVLRNYLYSLQAGGISLSGVGPTSDKPAILSTGNVISDNDIMFNASQGRQCIVVSDPAGVAEHSSNEVSRCVFRMGRSTVPAIFKGNGAVLVEKDNVTLAVATNN